MGGKDSPRSGGHLLSILKKNRNTPLPLCQIGGTLENKLDTQALSSVNWSVESFPEASITLQG